MQKCSFQHWTLEEETSSVPVRLLKSFFKSDTGHSRSFHVRPKGPDVCPHTHDTPLPTGVNKPRHIIPVFHQMICGESLFE